MVGSVQEYVVVWWVLPGGNGAAGARGGLGRQEGKAEHVWAGQKHWRPSYRLASSSPSTSGASITGSANVLATIRLRGADDRRGAGAPCTDKAAS